LQASTPGKNGKGEKNEKRGSTTKKGENREEIIKKKKNTIKVRF